GAIPDGTAFPILTARRRHAALREGAARTLASDGPRFGVELTAGGDRAIVLANAGAEPWRVPTGVTSPLDLLGGSVDDGQSVVAPHDVALIITSPQPDKTRY